MSAIIDFQLGKAPDSHGRAINEVWNFTPFYLEHDHKYVQWLFPIDTQTKFNRHAPVLTEKDRIAFARSAELQAVQQHSLLVMMDFFGLRWSSSSIVAIEQLNIRDHIWLKRGGHNHLRISRIIRSLALCGQLELSKLFQEAVLDIAHQQGEVSEESRSYWLSANQI